MSIPQNFHSLKQVNNNLNRSIISHVNINNQGHKHRKSMSLQNEIVDELKMKINYLTQQINQYKLLVAKLENQLKYKDQKLNISSSIIHNQSQQKINKSIIRSINKSQLFPKKDLIYSSNRQSICNTNNKTNTHVLEDVVKLLDVHCYNQIPTILKQKLKRLTKLQTFAECVSSMRIATSDYVQKPNSLTSNWKWLKQMIEGKQNQNKNRKSSCKIR